MDLVEREGHGDWSKKKWEIGLFTALFDEMNIGLTGSIGREDNILIGCYI